jgi:riboflavin kinase/FMN adenylyltransferase
MRIIEWEEFAGPVPAGGMELRNRPSSAVTIGVFDGIHLGHQALLEKIRRPHLVPMVITFKNSPKKVLRPDTYEGNILTLAQKLKIFESLGVELTVLIDFSENFRKLSGREFIGLVRERGNPAYAVIGGNFRCGYRLDADAAFIKKTNEERGIETDVLPPIRAGQEPVSSSRIRAAIVSGRLTEAAELLGRNIEIDLTGSSAVRENGGTFVEFIPRERILPPVGRYPVMLYGENLPDGKRAEIFVKPGGIFVPSRFNARSIEFLKSSQ